MTPQASALDSKNKSPSISYAQEAKPHSSLLLAETDSPKVKLKIPPQKTKFKNDPKTTSKI